MQLEDYFDFLDEGTIRIGNTRVGIETVAEAYKAGASPEEIRLRYPTLSLEQIHATITYYLAYRPQIDAYIQRVRDEQEAGWQEQQRVETPFLRELRERLAQERQRLSQDGQQGQPHAA